MSGQTTFLERWNIFLWLLLLMAGVSTMACAETGQDSIESSGSSVEPAETAELVEEVKTNIGTFSSKKKSALISAISQIRNFSGDGVFGVFGEPAKGTTKAFVEQFRNMMSRLVPDHPTMTTTLDHLINSLPNRKSRNHAIKAVAGEIQRLPRTPKYGQNSNLEVYSLSESESIIGFLEGMKELASANGKAGHRRATVSAIGKATIDLVDAFFPESGAKQILPVLKELKGAPGYFEVNPMLIPFFLFADEGESFRRRVSGPEYQAYAERGIQAAKAVAKTCNYASLVH